MTRTLPTGRLAAAAVALVAGSAGAQGWITDRTDNAIVNVDRIAARYQEQVREELARIGPRSAPLPPPGADSQRAVRSVDAWWQRDARRPTGETGRPVPVSLGFLYDSALINSAQVRVFGDLPAIRGTLEREVDGRYVPRAYLEGRVDNTNDPTRSIANTRGAERLIQRERAIEGGLRQRTLTGGEVTAGQRFLSVYSNSTDYLPSTQTSARTFITVVQPLLRDSGRNYTRSLHEVARLDGRVALSEFRRQVESHLLEVARAYWTLYVARASWLQKERATAAVRGIAGQIGGRGEIDAGPLLVSRARAALTVREADLLRARVAIRNAEARLRALVNDPRFAAEGVGELLPSDAPLTRYEALTLQKVLERAVALRPEIQQLFLQHRAAVLREGQAQIESLPRFDVILEGNIGGRDLDVYRYGDALGNTRTNQPGGLVGMRIEIPLGTDDAKVRLDRRRLETRQVESQGRATVATIVAEGEITLNEYNVAWGELAARASALGAARADLGVEAERWRQGVGGGEAAANALERLLGAQERLADAEERFVDAQASFTLAFLALQRVQGTFTSYEKLEIQRIDDAARGPSFVVRREGGAGAQAPANNGNGRTR